MPTFDFERADPPGKQAQFRLIDESGTYAIYIPAGREYLLQVRELNEYGPGPWSEGLPVVYLPEPSSTVLLLAGVLGLALLERIRR